MDSLIVNTKMDSIIRCLNRVKETMPANKEDFANSVDAQDIVVLNLSRAIQASVDIALHIISFSSQTVPQTMASSFDKLASLGAIDNDLAIKMKKSVGFRNIAVHSYDDIDLDILYSIATEHLDDYKQFIKQISAYCDN